MKTHSIIAFFVLFALPLLMTGQNRPTPEFDTRHKNIYLELLGSNILYGVNFDVRLQKGRMDGLGFRAGIGGFSTSLNDEDSDLTVGLVTFPLEVNHLVGKGRSSLVTGVGLLPVYATASGQGDFSNHEFVQGEGLALMGGFLTFGYRLQPRKSGLMLQVNWNPLIVRGQGFRAGWIGIGLGMGFK